MSGPAKGSDLIPAWVNGSLQPADKMAVHRLGQRHKAVSVFLTAGPMTLIQRRALGKYHTPGLWANACCTHPHWEEAAADCAVRRIGQELGLPQVRPIIVGQVEYRADVGGGMIEHESVDVFRAEIDRSTSFHPDPAEVMDLAWVSLPDLIAAVARDQDNFTPWLRIYLDDHLRAIFSTGPARTGSRDPAG